MAPALLPITFEIQLPGKLPLVRELVLETRADLVVLLTMVPPLEDVVCVEDTHSPWRAVDERAAVDLPEEAHLRVGAEGD
jgi:hypothetical protein